jgi:hypothetical protein
LIARITGRVDVRSDDETSITVAGSADAADAVRDWLVEFERAPSEAEPPR